MTSMQQSPSQPMEPSTSNVVMSNKTDVKNVYSRTEPERQRDYANRWFKIPSRRCGDTYPKFDMGVELQNQAFYLIIND